METQILMLVAVCGFFSGKFLFIKRLYLGGGGCRVLTRESSISKYTSEVQNAFRF